MEVLAGDVGGTHARLALVEIDGLRWSIGRRSTYASRDLEGLAEALERFRDESSADLPPRACIGVPCPVSHGRCHVTNLDWVVDADVIADRLDIARLRLVNDFDAIGHGVAMLGDGDLAEIQAGENHPGAPLAVIGAGTGLGEGFVVRSPAGPVVHSSEGGHADFAPADARQDRLLAFLRARYGHVSWERVVSGPGLENIYDFLVETGDIPERADTRMALQGEDPPQVISRLGASGQDPLCAEALHLFAAAFGAEAGNLALKVGAWGGVYVAGGIAPEVLDVLRRGPFLPSFRAKGRLSNMLAAVPVRVVLNTDVGLLGAATVAASEAGED